MCPLVVADRGARRPRRHPSPAVHRAAIGPAVVTLFGVFGFNGYLIFAALYAESTDLLSEAWRDLRG